MFTAGNLAGGADKFYFHIKLEFTFMSLQIYFL